MFYHRSYISYQRIKPRIQSKQSNRHIENICINKEKVKECFMVFLIFLFFALISFTIIYRACTMNPDFSTFKTDTYTVEKGDTLWGISKRYNTGEVDKREWIAKVRELNEIKDSGDIKPGDRLIVYVTGKTN